MSELVDGVKGLAAHDLPLLRIGTAQVTLGQLVTIALGAAFVLVATGWLRRLIADRLLAHGHVEASVRATIASLVSWVVLVVGLLVVLQTAGIDITALNVLAGALAVGVGFGLQNIASNFICGLIVMFERPVRIGDRVQLAGVEGDVVEIGARATRIATAQGSVVIMPNQKLVTEPVLNWAASHESTPLVLALSVDKASDLRATGRVLEEAVRAHPEVLREPPPGVCVTGLAGAAAFEVLAWVRGSAARRRAITHELYLALRDALERQGIELA